MRTMMLEERLHRDFGTPEDWACIAHSLGLSDLQPEPRDALRSRLRTIFQVYVNPNEPSELRPANYARALDRLKEDAQRLRADMWPPYDEYDAKTAEIPADAASSEELDKELFVKRIAALRRARLEAPFPDLKDNRALYIIADQLLGEAKHRELRVILNKLIVDADAARQQLVDGTGGQLPDWRLEHAIRCLAWVYYDHTRKAPGVSRNARGLGGPFLRVVKAVFRMFAPARLKGDEALVKTIGRAKKQNWPTVSNSK